MVPDDVADLSIFFKGFSYRIFNVPLDCFFQRSDGAAVGAAHGDDDIELTIHRGRKLFWSGAADINTYFFHYHDRIWVYAIPWLHARAVCRFTRCKGVKKPFRHLTAARISDADKKDFFHFVITLYVD